MLNFGVPLSDFKRTGEIPFDSARKLMSVSVKGAGGKNFVFTKGAPDFLLPLCKTKLRDGELVTSGGRVVGCTAVADTLPEAIQDAYEIAGQVHFENAYCRRDIGARALKAAQEG